ncbi:MAG TPA: PilZ domain-containing protein [Stellaceae bacterium]|nr:PilZ domain-containing protein [Candidatus Sulfotelmatobacter sp.]HVH82630.1 PilZ domain-containing protein [Stellaceae bacterium]
MTLSSMVVSRDWQEVSVLECILGGLQMDVAVENEPQRALARLAKSKIDALIVDCDLNGSSQFLRELQSADRQSNSIPLVIMGGKHCQSSLDQSGALFAFEKPISVEQAVRTLSAARNLILDGRLRYHRTGVEVPVSVRCDGRRAMGASMINLSQGGMQIRTEDLVDCVKSLQVSFDLPGARKGLKAKAEIAWQDKRGNLGIRFVKLARQQQRTLQLWLAQQYFAN